KANGESIDTNDIRKHKNDVFRLYQILDPTKRLQIPVRVRQDMKQFLMLMEDEGIDLTQLGITRQTKDDVLRNLRMIFCQ
ncbi:MAG: hypothetical protein Q8N36_00545, partial [bacterium]|nr:hypothetical protein [bacterium]